MADIKAVLELISICKKVITIDSAVVHFAGALESGQDVLLRSWGPQNLNLEYILRLGKVFLSRLPKVTCS